MRCLNEPTTGPPISVRDTADGVDGADDADGAGALPDPDAGINALNGGWIAVVVIGGKAASPPGRLGAAPWSGVATDIDIDPTC